LKRKYELFRIRRGERLGKIGNPCSLCRRKPKRWANWPMAATHFGNVRPAMRFLQAGIATRCDAVFSRKAMKTPAFEAGGAGPPGWTALPIKRLARNA
jgi:hypothetical protein